MSKSILITGGAGFIGQQLGKRLTEEGNKVTVLDSFSPQIHGASPRTDLSFAQKVFAADIRDRDAVSAAIAGQNSIVHLAAETGTGQSMYEITRYESVNIGGTAILLEALQAQNTPVEKIVVASSRATYGEGAYRCGDHGVVFPGARTLEDMTAGHFEPRCPECGAFVGPVATPETCPFKPSSFYGLTKQVQEQMVLMLAPSMGISATALRYQNVYGPGQSLKNPYTGILAIFSNLARKNEPINIFEDGLESRDFVHVDDVVDATCRALFDTSRQAASYNVGSGVPTTVQEVAQRIVSYFGSTSEIKTSGDFRLGDIRHNLADLTAVTADLGFTPKIGFEEGLKTFLSWASESEVPETGFTASLEEMRSRGLLANGKADAG